MQYSLNWKALLTLVCSITVLSGCGAWHTERVDVQFALCSTPPMVDTLQLSAIEPVPLQDPGGDWWVALNEESYENLLINLLKLKATISQRDAVIGYYSSCVTEHSKTE